jgi:hypothetical protein
MDLIRFNQIPSRLAHEDDVSLPHLLLPRFFERQHYPSRRCAIIFAQVWYFGNYAEMTTLQNMPSVL